MVDVRQEGDSILFDVRGLHKLWALKSRLRVSRANIVNARKDDAVARGKKGLRMPGTYIPGVITAGTFYRAGRRTFWDVSDPGKAVVVELTRERYGRLIIEVADPDAVVSLLAGDVQSA